MLLVFTSTKLSFLIHEYNSLQQQLVGYAPGLNGLVYSMYACVVSLHGWFRNSVCLVDAYPHAFAKQSTLSENSIPSGESFAKSMLSISSLHESQESSAHVTRFITGHSLRLEVL
jgi:hypothetical protein